MDNTYAITEHRIRQLADRHILRYSRMIESASTNPYIRVDECKNLLAIWHSVVEKGCRWASLGPREQQEVFEAYEDELYG